jgi:hypothetical protein
MTNVGYWTTVENTETGHAPEWVKVKIESEKEAKIM